MKALIGRRFVFASIAIVCATVTTVFLKYDGETYFKLVGVIVGIFTLSQSWTDLKREEKNGGKN